MHIWAISYARVDKLVELDERRREAFDKMVVEKEMIKGTLDQSNRNEDFKVGDVILLWDKNKEKPRNHGKLEKIWMGPYKVSQIARKGFVSLEKLDGEELEFPYNGWLLEHYFPLVDWEPYRLLE